MINRAEYDIFASIPHSMPNEEIDIFSLSASFFASLLGFTLNAINIETDQFYADFNVEVFDISGKLLLSSTSSTISLKSFASGMYIVKVKCGDTTQELKVEKH